MIFAGRSGSISIPSKYKSAILIGGGMNSGVIGDVTPTNCTVALVNRQDLVYTSSTHIMGSLWYIDNIGDNANISLSISNLNQICIYVVGFTDKVPEGAEPVHIFLNSTNTSTVLRNGPYGGVLDKYYRKVKLVQLGSGGSAYVGIDAGTYPASMNQEFDISTFSSSTWIRVQGSSAVFEYYDYGPLS